MRRNIFTNLLKKFACKWTHTIQTCAVQGSSVYFSAFSLFSHSVICILEFLKVFFISLYTYSCLCFFFFLSIDFTPDKNISGEFFYPINLLCSMYYCCDCLPIAIFHFWFVFILRVLGNNFHICNVFSTQSNCIYTSKSFC